MRKRGQSGKLARESQQGKKRGEKSREFECLLVRKSKKRKGKQEKKYKTRSEKEA